VTDSARIAQYYDALVARYGDDPRSVDAPSPEALEVRYRALAEVAPLSGKSVLEVGCGFGGLGHYLRARHEDVRYTGIDVSPGLIRLGREVHPELELREDDLLELEGEALHDVVLAQGIFYLLGEGAEARTQELVERMFRLAREAVAFSAISTWAARQDPDEYRVDPVRLLEFVQHLTGFVVLRHDYHPGDVTFYLYRRSTA
jgi:SAM-dependent methyltransferase